MTEYKLYFFNFRARTELSRLIFVAAGQKYEDIRISKEDWIKVKHNAPFRQLPYLEIIGADGSVFKLAQAMSIARYLAKEFDLCGKNKKETAECDMYSDLLNDLFDLMCQTYFETDESRKSEYKLKLAETSIPLTMHYLEEKLRLANTGYLVGDSLTYLDLYTFNILEMLGQNGKLIFETFPLLNGHFNLIRNVASIANWLKVRPESNMENINKCTGI